MKNQNLENNENKITVINDDQVKQFQSLYYLIKGKRDTDIKLFTDFKQFTFSDIIELNGKVYRKLHLHELVTDIVNVTVGLDNKEIKSFGNWVGFKNTDWSISATTKYIAIEWDFNLILPNQTHKIPQTHNLRVRIGNNLKPSEMIQVMFQGGDEFELDEAQSQMSCKIDFVNSLICNELKTIVSNWYEALPKNSEDHKLIKFIIKNEVKLQNFIILSFLTACTILINFLFNFLMTNNLGFLPKEQLSRVFMLSTCSFIIYYIFYQLGKLFAGRMSRKQIGKLRRNPMFEFTKGDRNKVKDVEKQNKKHLLKLFITILTGILINGLSALIWNFN